MSNTRLYEIKFLLKQFKMTNPIMQLLLFCFITQQTFAAKDTLDISFESDHYEIDGKILAPKNRSIKMPVVIFLVGSGGNSSYSTNYADFINFFLEQPLANENIALMYFDKRGVGQSEGKWYKTNFEQRALDAKNAAEYRDYDESGAIYGRLKNYFIFSIYTHKLDGGSPETYLGILGNFFRQW